MTESTGHLTSAQAAARLGVKPATLYAYVSRGLLPRHRSPDGRTSLFDPNDVARLAKRGSTARGTPSDVLVASELTSTSGGLWYRGVDAIALSRERSFEEVAAWLWTGRFDRKLPWRCDRKQPRTRTLPIALAQLAAEERPNDARTGASLLSCLVGSLAGHGDGTIASVLASKLGGSAEPRTIDHALSLVCEQGLTKAALAARLAAAAGSNLAEAVTAAMVTSSAVARTLTSIEEAVADGFSLRSLDDETVATAFPKEPFRTEDPRVPALLALVPDHGIDMTVLRDELRRRGEGPPSALFGLAVLSVRNGMSRGSAGKILLIARTVGWIAHALEEHRQPTPYRPRLAYTGPSPRSAPGRTLDAVRNYLSENRSP